jgi:hypothetical protein
MIGPHEGKELELMLAGKKPLAAFYDELPTDGKISEEIIPEKAFHPYVLNGIIKRLSEDVTLFKDKSIVRVVCFCLPDEEWRARFLLWLKRETYSGRISHDSSHEYIIGGLLGYETADIEDFVKKRH